MEKNILKAEVREDVGKSSSKGVRREGKVPAVVYKDGKIGNNIQVDSKALWRALHTEAGENAIITLQISGGGKDTKKTCIVQDIQTHPMSDKVIHVDFHEISLKDKIKVKVPVTIKGEAVGVAENNGVLAQLMWELEVECLPAAIPEHFDVHVNDMKIGDSICIKDLESISDVSFLDDAEQMVVSVHAPKVEIEEVEEVPEEGAGVEPELIKKGKKEEGAEEEAGE